MPNADSPFKFLDSYRKEDKSIFFGRDEEVDALYEALSGVKLLLVYGPSGAGKTSIIECGLRNQFSDADWFAISIRRGINIVESVFAQLNQALTEKIEIEEKTSLPRDPSIDFQQAVEYLFDERFQPVYLLFDQFEELLISGNFEEQLDFFERLNRLISYQVPCRVILIMREEFIGHLSEFEYVCPSIFQHRFRLEKMVRTNVQNVLVNMLESPYYQQYFEVEQVDDLAKKILSKLPDDRREIELAYVQVYLNELWDRGISIFPNSPILNSRLIRDSDDLESVLDNFLKKQLTILEVTYGEQLPLEILAALITEKYTKIQMSEKDLTWSLEDRGIHIQQSLLPLLNELSTLRIVRSIKVKYETQYEISHDVLAQVVGNNLTEEIKLRRKAKGIYEVYAERTGLFSREDIDYIRAFKAYLGYPKELEKRIAESEINIKESREKELEEARRIAEQESRLRENAEVQKQKAEASEQRFRKISIIAAFIAAFALLATLLVYILYDNVNTQKSFAKFQEAKAKEQERIALRARDSLSIKIEQERKLKFEKYFSTGKTSLNTGSYREAIIQFNIAKDHSDDPQKLDSLIQLAKQKIDFKIDFDSYINRGDEALENDNLLLAMDYYNAAIIIDLDDIKASATRNKIEKCKIKMLAYYKQLIREAEKFDLVSKCGFAINRVEEAQKHAVFLNRKDILAEEISTKRIVKNCTGE